MVDQDRDNTEDAVQTAMVKGIWPGIRLVALDLDGTLFDSHKRISFTNAQAVRKAVAHGMTVAIVTGRHFNAVHPVETELGLKFACIASAGGYIYPGNGLPALARPMDTQAARQVVAFAQSQAEWGMFIEHPEGAHWCGSASYLGPYIEPVGAVPTSEPWQVLEQPPIKITVFNQHERLKWLNAEINQRFSGVASVFSGENFIDLTRRGVDKGSSLVLLAEQLGLPLTQVAAIGDMPLDIRMLEVAGVSAAMGNAEEPVKQVADWLAPGNDEDGVAWFLDELMARNAQAMQEYGSQEPGVNPSGSAQARQ